jgi:hypothetical protein
VVKVEVYIPGDAEAGVVPGRFPDKLAASQLITVTVQDAIAPDTFITAYLDDPTNSLDASFEFYCSEASCTYECKIDSETWVSCTSPQTYICTESWTATTTANAPTGRWFHTAIWTGNEMIVWGGGGHTGNHFNTGGRYNPVTDSWTATASATAPSARWYHTAIWTGSRMIVWGGGISGVSFNTGGNYNPTTNSWTATTTTNAPVARRNHTAVWTGTEMIVWGGWYDYNLNTGGRYNPVTDSWTATTTTNAPSARSGHAAVWTGTEMIVFGGWNGSSYFNSGGRYVP